MTVPVGDHDPVSFAAAQIYPHEPSAAPQPARPDEHDTPHAAQGDAIRPSARVRGRRRPRGPPPGDDDLDLFDIPTVCRRSRLGRTFVYEAIRRGELRAFKYGRATRILRKDYEDWLEAAPAIAPTIVDDHVQEQDATPRPPLLAGRRFRSGAPR
jgi:excisionase family DNA binding protein